MNARMKKMAPNARQKPENIESPTSLNPRTKPTIDTVASILNRVFILMICHREAGCCPGLNGTLPVTAFWRSSSIAQNHTEFALSPAVRRTDGHGFVTETWKISA